MKLRIFITPYYHSPAYEAVSTTAMFLYMMLPRGIVTQDSWTDFKSQWFSLKLLLFFLSALLQIVRKLRFHQKLIIEIVMVNKPSCSFTS